MPAVPSKARLSLRILAAGTAGAVAILVILPVGLVTTIACIAFGLVTVVTEGDFLIGLPLAAVGVLSFTLMVLGIRTASQGAIGRVNENRRLSAKRRDLAGMPADALARLVNSTHGVSVPAADRGPDHQLSLVDHDHQLALVEEKS